MQAMWVVRDVLSSKERIVRMVDTAKKYSFTDLIVQVRGRGKAYYRSSVEPPAPRDADLDDPLQFLLEQLQGSGIRVHAWINTLLTWSSAALPEGHVFARHPDWSMHSAEGKSALDELLTGTLDRSRVEGAYLCPSRPEVMEYLTNVYSEVAEAYPVDGIHLDYVRYPNAGYCHCPVCQEAAAGWDEFAAYRRHAVTQVTKAIRDACKKVRPDIVYSAAVFPEPDVAAEDKGQAWPEWTAKGLVDLLFPMAYNSSAFVTLDSVLRVKRLSAVPVVAGVGTYLQSPYEMKQTLHMLKSLDLAGVCHFSYNTFEKSPEYLDVIIGTGERASG